MKILQINTTDQGGGAELTMLDLHQQLEEMGHQSHCLVGFKKSDLSFVSELQKPNSFQKAKNRLAKEQGREVMSFPSVLKQIKRLDFKPDIIYCHNLHGDYFDLRELPELSQRFPVLVHLHDMWLLTGHCAQSFNCEKWKTGCGDCPDLNIYPSIKKDATAFNWKRKREILRQSRLHFICPSNWIANKLRKSEIPAPSINVIPNAVNTEIFKPGDKKEAKKKIGISTDDKVILFSAKNPDKNEFKDFETLKKAVIKLAEENQTQQFKLLCLGSNNGSLTIEQFNNLTIEFHPFQNSPKAVATYYQAADIYAHPAKAETFGRSIIEAMACGIPVVVSDVGGISEIIEHNKTGRLFKAGDEVDLVEKINYLLLDKREAEVAAKAALSVIGSKYNLSVVSRKLELVLTAYASS